MGCTVSSIAPHAVNYIFTVFGLAQQLMLSQVTSHHVDGVVRRCAALLDLKASAALDLSMTRRIAQNGRNMPKDCSLNSATNNIQQSSGQMVCNKQVVKVNDLERSFAKCSSHFYAWHRMSEAETMILM